MQDRSVGDSDFFEGQINRARNLEVRWGFLAIADLCVALVGLSPQYSPASRNHSIAGGEGLFFAKIGRQQRELLGLRHNPSYCRSLPQ